jgi:hypothetical protein
MSEERFPGYDVLSKRDSPSWNDATRRVIEHRIAQPMGTGALNERQRDTLRRLVDCVVPQPAQRPRIDTAAILVAELEAKRGTGFRPASLPVRDEAWRRGLDALDAEALARHARHFAFLDAQEVTSLLACVERGEVKADAWRDISPADFFAWRLLPDIVSAYYAHPSAWSAMGFGGPASPRGYVRLRADRRDPWEAAEEGDGKLIPVQWRNRHVG